MIERVVSLEIGERIFFGGDQCVRVDAALAEAFEPGDRLIVVQSSGTLIHVPQAVDTLVGRAVANAAQAFVALSACSDESISEFYDSCARALCDPTVIGELRAANAADVESAIERGRATSRLQLSDRMLADMVAGLQSWRDMTGDRSQVVGTVGHGGWSVEAFRAPLGVVAFVFEGRPNVFADACGVLRTGNTMVFRIGSDALRTARAIIDHAIVPALASSGLPEGSVQLVDSVTHAAGHALFSDPRVSMAIARGSGAAVAELGAVAIQSGTPASLHGTGGAWLIVGESADIASLCAAVEHSVDRKVCNTLNVIAVVRARAEEFVSVALAAVDVAAADPADDPENSPIIHVVDGSQWAVAGDRTLDVVPIETLSTEWEWEHAPEITVVVVDDVDSAVALFNRYSPRFVASLISTDLEERERFESAVEAPFVGNGFTRWVDGQYALDRPELGLSNWEFGRLLGRGAILSGDGIHTIRHRAIVTDVTTHR